jgi:hypothetical protein
MLINPHPSGRSWNDQRIFEYEGNEDTAFFWVLAAGSLTGFARLGETPQIIAQRYGAPVSTGAIPGFTRCLYEKESFAITIFYQNGVSVMESFARRGLDQATARQLATVVAAHDISCPSPGEESRIREEAGITFRDEVFWIWTTGAEPVSAAFNPLECSIAFFSAPAMYATIHQALASDSLAGS